jgi:hypothetical protein
MLLILSDQFPVSVFHFVRPAFMSSTPLETATPSPLVSLFSAFPSLLVISLAENVVDVSGLRKQLIACLGELGFVAVAQR